jgi:hypothetical protein
MAVREVTVDDRAGLRRFIRLERELHGDEPLFVSAIDADEEKFLSGET